jgi:hypothetical protein
MLNFEVFGLTFGVGQMGHTMIRSIDNSLMFWVEFTEVFELSEHLEKDYLALKKTHKIYTVANSLQEQNSKENHM